MAPGVLPGAGQACPHWVWELTRATGTVWVSSPRGHPMHPLGKTCPCSDPISFSLQGSQGEPGPPGPPVRSHPVPCAGDCHARGTSARMGVPPGSREVWQCWDCTPASSLTCATSKRSPEVTSPYPLVPRRAALAPQGPRAQLGPRYGIGISWHLHWHRHVQPGRGEQCPATLGGWREGHILGCFGMQGGAFWAGCPLGSSQPWGTAPWQAQGRGHDHCGWWVGAVGLTQALSSQGDPGDPGSGIRVSTCVLPTSTSLAPPKTMQSPHSWPAPLPRALLRGSQGPGCARAARCPVSDVAISIAGLAWSPGRRGAAWSPRPPWPRGEYLQPPDLPPDWSWCPGCRLISAHVSLAGPAGCPWAAGTSGECVVATCPAAIGVGARGCLGGCRTPVPQPGSYHPQGESGKPGMPGRDGVPGKDGEVGMPGKMVCCCSPHPVAAGAPRGSARGVCS